MTSQTISTGGSARHHKRAVRRRIEAGQSWPFVVYTPDGMTYDWWATKCFYINLRSVGVRELPRDGYRARWRNWWSKRRLTRAVKAALSRKES